MQDHLSGRYLSAMGTNDGRLSKNAKRSLNERLEAIFANFGAAWLAEREDHPVRELWSRKDGLATCELLCFGDAIYSLSPTNPRWTSAPVEQIKAGNPSNRSGAIFELIGLNLFHCEAQRVTGAAKHNPGYDGTVTFSDGSSMLVSIKNHGMSSYEKLFRREAINIDNRFRLLLESRLDNGVQLFARADAYPSTENWEKLNEALNPLITELTKHPEFAANLDTKVNATIGHRWTIEISSTPRIYKPLSPLRLSAGVKIAAPPHPNERLNFWNSILQACSNMSKQTRNEPAGVARALLIRLSRSASVRLYIEWLGNYFVQYPEEPIDFIFLYQADAAVDVDEHQLKRPSPIL